MTTSRVSKRLWAKLRARPGAATSHRERGCASATCAPMTAATAKPQRPLWQMVILALPLVAMGWVATLAAVALLSDAAPARYVLLPPDTLLSDMPDAALVGAGRLWLVLASDRPGFTAALYRAGAVLVLPAGLEPCGPKPRSGLKYT